MQRYYLDTSIWLDLFEDRDEVNFPKSKIAQELIDKIIKNDGKIIISDEIFHELLNLNYSYQEIKEKLRYLSKVLIFINSSKKEIGKAKDLSKKRNIPKGDALHAILSRNNGAILISFDSDFEKLKDITKTRKPGDIS